MLKKDLHLNRDADEDEGRERKDIDAAGAANTAALILPRDTIKYIFEFIRPLVYRKIIMK